MPRYEVIKARVWRHPSGRTASVYGAYPGDGWTMIDAGWTVRDNVTGTVGIGRQPWATREDAEAWVASRS